MPRRTYLQKSFLDRVQRELAETETFILSILEVYEYTWELIEEIIRRNYLQLEEEYAMVHPLDRQMDGLKLSQLAIYETIQRQIVAESLVLLGKQDDLVIPYMKQAIEKGYLTRAYDYKALQNDLSSYFFFDANIVELITQRRWFGGNYFTRSLSNNTRLAGIVDELLQKGAVQGFPLEYMVLQLRKAYDIEIGRAKTLIQSEVAFVLEQANYQVMEDIGLEKYQYLATLEINTCNKCRPLDSKIFYLSKAEAGVNYPPIHGNCRCTAIGYVEGAPHKKRWMRDPVTGKGRIINAISYDEWFKQYVVKSTA